MGERGLKALCEVQDERIRELKAENKKLKHDVGQYMEIANTEINQSATLITELRNLKRYKYGIDYDRGGNKFAECYDDDDGEWIKAADITALLNKQEGNSDG